MRFLFLFLFFDNDFFTVALWDSSCWVAVCAKNGYFYNFIISPAPSASYL